MFSYGLVNFLAFFAYAEICDLDAREFTAYGLYNPAVALKVDDEIITNDIEFDENAMI